MTFSRDTESFIKENEASLIASTSDNDFLAKDHSSFQMDTLAAARQCTVAEPLNCIFFKVSFITATIKKTVAPISLRDFSDHVADMHKNKNHGFEVEYAVCKKIVLNTVQYCK